MSIDSKKLQDFLHTNIFHRLSYLKHPVFSQNSTQLLREVLNKLCSYEKEFDLSKIVTNNLEYDYIPKGIHYELCPHEVKTYTNKMRTIGKSFGFSIGKRQIKVYLIYEYESENNNNPQFKRFFDNAIHRIYLLISLLQSYSNDECSQHLTLYLYLTNMKKTLDDCDEKCKIEEKNANSAFTFACRKKNEVYIYRKEEWFKVLTHELFHSFGLDFAQNDSHDINNKVYSIFPIKTDLRLYESYCEIWAELLNCIFIAFFSIKCSENDFIQKVVKKIQLLIHQEIIFSVFQSTKVLSYFGMTYSDLYERTSNAINIRQMYYRETTPVLSYYIIKTILIFHIDDFLSWCFTHNTGSLGSLNFDKSSDELLVDNINHFIDFIRKHHQDELFIKSSQDIREWFIKQEKTNRLDNTPIRTLRMSLLE